jgi:hypothetical protein
MRASEITLIVLLSICVVVALFSMSQGSSLIKDGWLLPVLVAQIWSVVVYSNPNN